MQINDELRPLTVYKYEVSAEMDKLVRQVLLTIPDTYTEDFPSFSVIEALSPGYARFERHSYEEVGRLYFDPDLPSLSSDVAIGLIAHQFARLFIERTPGGYVGGEHAADDLATRWGFRDEIRAMRQIIGPPT
jgi:hypothetical protein